VWGGGGGGGGLRKEKKTQREEAEVWSSSKGQKDCNTSPEGGSRERCGKNSLREGIGETVANPHEAGPKNRGGGRKKRLGKPTLERTENHEREKKRRGKRERYVVFVCGERSRGGF